jgi:hypothetical protein
METNKSPEDDSLVEAAKRGDYEAVKKQLKEFDALVIRASCHAARRGHDKVFKLLFEVSQDYDKVLWYAAKNGHSVIVDEIFRDIDEYGVLPKYDQSFEDIVLDQAASGGHLHLVEKMIERGARGFDGALYNAVSGCSQNPHKIEVYIPIVENIVNHILKTGATNGAGLAIMVAIVDKLEPILELLEPLRKSIKGNSVNSEIE